MTYNEYLEKDYYISSRWSSFGLIYIYDNTPIKSKRTFIGNLKKALEL